MTDAPAQTVTRSVPVPFPVLVSFLAGSVLLMGATLAFAQDAEPDNEAFGYSNFGELKYGPDDILGYVNPDAPKGGEFSSWSLGTFDSFNRYARKGNFEPLSTIGTERLMISTLDDPYAAYCFLCTSVEWPDDRSYVTFNLREDVTFSDGTPMTAEDVAFTHNLFVEQGIPEYRALVENYYAGVDVLDPYRIRFNFNQEAPYRDRIFFAGGAPVFSKKWFEDTGARLDESTTEPFMATGAYTLGSVDFGRQVVYVRNPDYWGTDLPMNQGRDNFDRIRVDFFTDTDAAFEAFKSGVYNFRAEDDPAIWETGYDFRALSAGDVIRESVPDGTVAQRLSWPFNLNNEAWKDIRVREAIQMMFNFEWSNETLYYGQYAQPYSFWTNTDLSAEGPPSDAELPLLQPLVDEGLLPETILTDDAVIPVVHEPGSNLPSRSIRRRASALLEEAGWTLGDDGARRNEAGDLLELTHVQFNPKFDKLINPFIDNLANIGIRAKLERVDGAQYSERRDEGDFDMASHGIQMSFEPSVSLEQWFGSKNADASSRNLMRLKDPAVDRLIPTIASADTLDTLRPAVQALDRVLRYLRFDVPIYYNPTTHLAYYTELKHPDPLPPLGIGQLDVWWYDDSEG